MDIALAILTRDNSHVHASFMGHSLTRRTFPPAFVRHLPGDNFADAKPTWAALYQSATLIRAVGYEDRRFSIFVIFTQSEASRNQDKGSAVDSDDAGMRIDPHPFADYVNPK